MRVARNKSCLQQYYIAHLRLCQPTIMMEEYNMRIVNSLVEDFGDFELDASAIKPHSENFEDIMLPYDGDLPAQMSPASSVFLLANIQLIQGSNLTLIVNRNGKNLRRPVEATTQEIVDLMDNFFEQQDTGLDAYWLGFWQAHYMAWRQIAKDFRRVLRVVRSLPIEAKMYISKHILE